MRALPDSPWRGCRGGGRERRIALPVFSNKAALLFRLQSDEWRESSDLLRAIPRGSGMATARTATGACPRLHPVECEEAAVRRVVERCRPALPQRARSGCGESRRRSSVVLTFLEEVLPNASDERARLPAICPETTMSQVGKTFSETSPSSPTSPRFADAMVDMFCAYLKQVWRSRRGSRQSGSTPAWTRRVEVKAVYPIADIVDVCALVALRQSS